MKSIKLLMIIILLSIFSIAHSQTWEGIEHYLYYGDTGKDVTVQWIDPGIATTDPLDDYNPLTDNFELIIYNKDRNYTVKIADIPADVFEWTFKVPRIGFWIPKIRLKRVEVVDGVESVEYTEWTDSTDAKVSKVNGVDRGWWLFAWLAPTGGIVLPYDVRVSSQSDEAEENGNTQIVTLTSSDLELVNEAGVNNIVGLRFPLDIQQNANIAKAYIQFKADEISIDAVSLKIEGENIDDAPIFTASNGNVSGRSRTLANVLWTPVAWNTIGDEGLDQRTPDISIIIQEIVNRVGWVKSNNIVIIFSGTTTGKRIAVSWNGDPNGAPLLHVEYSQ